MSLVLAVMGGALTALEALPAPRLVADAIHVTVRHEKGRCFGWPANCGIWSWGNEILVQYRSGEFQDKPVGSHDINYNKPIVVEQSRSFDGGLTWTQHTVVPILITEPGFTGPAGAKFPEFGPPLKGVPALTVPIDFSDPNTILHFSWGGYLYYSTDRGTSWTGPFQLPLFDMVSWQLRTDYLVEDRNTVLAFWSGSKAALKRNENGGMVYMVKTTNGGLTWTLVSRVSRLVEPSETVHDVALMPSTVRVSPTKLVTCIRNLTAYPKVGWIECRFSNDNGRTWRLQSIPVNDEAGTTPPALSRLPDGRLVLTYGYRRPLLGPTSIRARISEDDGATWGQELILRTGGGDEDIGYTRNAVRPDGKVVTIYYWQEDEKAERDIAATIWMPPARAVRPAVGASVAPSPKPGSGRLVGRRGELIVTTAAGAEAPGPTESPSIGPALAEKKGLLAVSHESHDYREPVIQIDLTQEGPADWLYCGADDAKKNPVIYRKAGVPRLIGEPRTLAGTTRVYKDNRPLRFNFSDGTPMQKLADSQVAWWFRHADAHGAGLEVPLVADRRERIAKVFLGYWNGTGRFRARLTDGSAPPFEETVKKAGWENRIYTLRYRAGSDDQQLILSFECLGAGIKDGNIEFQALAIRNADDAPPAKPAAAASASSHTRAKVPVVSNKISDACQPVSYAAQRLDPQSYLGRRVDLNFRTGLLQTFDVDMYLDTYGQAPKWPSGEYLGKFMQGLSAMLLYTGEPAAKERLDKIVATWRRVQAPDGWLGTTQRFKSWDIWEHKYVLLGLVDYHALTGDGAAIEMARKIGDLVCANIGPGRGDIMQSGHWALGSASILEPMVYLYRYTGEPRYLRFCEYIMDAFEGPTGPKLISILATGSKRVCDIQDPWASRAAREIRFGPGMGQVRNRSKAYELLSCIIGLARMYQLTGKPEYLTVAVNAWEDIATKRLYLAGSSGADECFKDDHCLPADTADGPAEGCVTAHWIYLSRLLFEITGEARYADAIENALYNYLLASQRPQDCFQSYNTPLNGVKTFARHDPQGKAKSAPCCLSSVMREIARTPETVWAKFANGGLGVVLYQKGWMEDTIKTATGDPVSVRVEMDTQFPRSGEVTLRVQPQRVARFRLGLRVPAWAKDFRATIAGQTLAGTPGQFLNLQRDWQPGDTVTITMDLNERLVPGGASYPGYFAFMRGPQVLSLMARPGAEGNLDTARVKADAGVRLAPVLEFLPRGWIGDQAYTSPALVGAEDCALVPFADAGQPGLAARYRTWIRLQPGTGAPVPRAPSGLKATALGRDCIQLSWADNSQDENGFRVERKRADVGLWFHVKTTSTGVSTCVDDAVNVVTAGKTYTYRVAAYNAGGLSAYSEEVTVTTPAVSVPAAPSGLKATAMSSSQINLEWTDHSDNEEGFRVQRRVGAGEKWTVVAGRVPADWPRFTDYGLDSGQTYIYRVCAYNAAGESGWSNEAAATTPAADAGNPSQSPIRNP